MCTARLRAYDRPTIITKHNDSDPSRVLIAFPYTVSGEPPQFYFTITRTIRATGKSRRDSHTRVILRRRHSKNDWIRWPLLMGNLCWSTRDENTTAGRPEHYRFGVWRNFRLTKNVKPVVRDFEPSNTSSFQSCVCVCVVVPRLSAKTFDEHSERTFPNVTTDIISFHRFAVS